MTIVEKNSSKMKLLSLFLIILISEVYAKVVCTPEPIAEEDTTEAFTTEETTTERQCGTTCEFIEGCDAIFKDWYEECVCNYDCLTPTEPDNTITEEITNIMEEKSIETAGMRHHRKIRVLKCNEQTFSFPQKKPQQLKKSLPQYQNVGRLVRK